MCSSGKTVSLEQRFSFRRIDVDIFQVTGDVRQSEQAFIHHWIPEERHISEQVGAEITVRQSRQVVEMSQRLITAQRMRVMVRMSLQVKKHEIAIYMIAVPGVMWMTTFVFTVFIFLPQQAIVLDVVGARQLPPREEVVNNKKENQLPAECNDQAELKQDS